MAGMKITVSCMQCNARVNCTKDEWVAGIICNSCNSLIQRPQSAATQQQPAPQTGSFPPPPLPHTAATAVMAQPVTPVAQPAAPVSQTATHVAQPVTPVAQVTLTSPTNQNVSSTAPTVPQMDPPGFQSNISITQEEELQSDERSFPLALPQ